MVFPHVKPSPCAHWKLCIPKLHDKVTGLLFLARTLMHIWTYRDRYHCRDVLACVCQVVCVLQMWFCLEEK